MTDKDKQRIARLVADKVWGWKVDFDQGSIDVTDQVFSWPGFGRTVDSMAAFGWAWGRSGGNTIDGPGSIYWMHREVETPIDCEEKIDDQILDCHLAALDAFGIDWRTDND